uniref:Major capsid protein n=1 Tax=Dulem virus 172 TaxID=3145649 RepID=A0AAU8AZD3_9VIRU
MNRNQNSHFSKNPQADIKRSRFRRNQSVKFSFNAGELIPFYVDEVLPGDTMQIDTSKLVRMQTLATPVMDNIYLDTYYFFVPNRLIWSHWKEFMGENTSAPWFPDVEYSVPIVHAPDTASTSSGAVTAANGHDGWKKGTIADYMGIPINVKGFDVNGLPFRAYALIWNEWFRDQNLQTPLDVVTSDIKLGGANIGYDFDKPSFAIQSACSGGMPLPVGKYRDYFTSCLPAPQKGPDVLLPLGSVAPVFSDTTLGEGRPGLIPKDLYLDRANGSESRLAAMSSSWYRYTPGSFDLTLESGTGDIGVSGTGTSISDGSWGTSGANGGKLFPANLWTDLTAATAATINQLRLAFQIQKIYEKDARGGTRYIEIIANHFGVTSPDSRMQRPEYLGGNRMMINVNQVVQNSESATTPQGTTTAYSLTVDTHSDFTHSFVEHGFLIGVMCARYDHTYQQGLERFWSRKNRFDYYWPTLANIGEQPVYNREIFVEGSSNDDGVFGYQEAWADYRYKPSRVSGEMRSAAENSLDVWHLADDYSELPHLSPEWIAEDKTNIDRVLAITSKVSNQFFCDIFVQNISTRPMPMFSVPGLIDHH